MLATAREGFYIHEPLNPQFAPHYLRLSDIPYYWKITDSDTPRIQAAFEILLSGQFPRIDHHFFRTERRFISRFPQVLSFRWAALRGKRFIIKDPFMLFNVDWMEDRFNTHTVLVTRTPYAFVASLKAKNWTFDFRHFTSQPALMEKLSAPDHAAVEAAASKPIDLIAQGCLLWRILNREIHRLAQANPSRILCKHEELLAAPEAHFRQLFTRLGLTWTSKTTRFLNKQQRASLDPVKPAHAANKDFITAWQSRLTQSEIERIGSLTQ